jgi:Ca2+-binding RTX toxin-like protein
MMFLFRRCLQQLRRWFALTPSRHTASRPQAVRRLGLEALEQRTVPALLALPDATMGEQLDLHLAGLLNPTLEMYADGSGQFTFSNKAAMQLERGDLLNVTGGRFDFVLDLRVGRAQVGGMSDVTSLNLDANGNLQLTVNGRDVMVSDLSNVGSLTLRGSDANDTLTIGETNGKLLTELGGFTDNAEGSHLNAGMAQYLQSTGRDNLIDIHFDGGAGLDLMRFQTATMRHVHYVGDLSAASRSGNVLVSGANGTQEGGLLLSFANLEPFELSGAGGIFTADLTGISVAGDLITVEDAVGDYGDGTIYVAGDGFNAITSTNVAWETPIVSGFDEIEVIAGDDAQTIVLASLDSASTETKVTIRGDDPSGLGTNIGDDTINLETANAGGNPVQVDVFAGGGNDAINVGDTTNSLDPILGAVNIDGEDGTDTINVNDQGNTDAQTYDITNATVDRTGAGTITYANAEALIVNAATLGDTVNVLSTLATTPVIVNGGTGDDTFNVGNAANSLDDIVGQLDVNGDGDTDVLNLNDNDDADANTYDIEATKVSRTGGVLVNYTTVETLNVNAGDGADVLNILTTSVLTNLTGNDGDDKFIFATDGITLLGGTINGGLGIDTLDYTAYTTSVNANLGAEHLFTSTLDGAQENPPTGSAATGLAWLVFNSGTGTFDVRIDVQGILLDDIKMSHIHVGAVGVNGSVIFDLGDSTQWSNTTGGLVTRTAVGVTFPAANVGDLLAGNTYFNVHTTAFATGEIRGQILLSAAPNTSTGTGGIANLENAIGGSNADLLTGSAAANKLEGLAGNDVIQSRAGNDTLLGGDGNDLLIGGAGSDTMQGGNNDDRMLWNNGDGTDVMDGEAGNDIAEVNGSQTKADQFTINVVGGDIEFKRINFGNFAIDIGTTETLDVFGGDGDDTFTVGNLSGATDLVDLFMEGGNQNDRFEVTPNSKVNIFVDGGQPGFVPPPPGFPPGDTLVTNLTGFTGGRADLNGIGLLNFTGGTGGSLPIFAKNIETENEVTGDYELYVNLDSTVKGSFNGPTGSNGIADTVSFQLDVATGTILEIRFNGVLAFTGNVNAIKALSIEGSADAETILFQESGGRLITEGTAAAFGAGNFQGTATGTNVHLNPAMANFLGATNNVQFNFDGDLGFDALKFVNTSKRNVRYAADKMTPANSGNISISGVGGTPISVFRLSFSNLAPISFVGAGGTVTADATGIAAAGDVYDISDDATAGDGVSVITSTNVLFETTDFQGFDEVELFAGDFDQTINFNSLDAAATETKVTLRGDDSLADITDDGADTINVFTANAGGNPVDVFVFGQAGNDTINVGDPTNSLDPILGNVTVNGEDNDAAPTIDFACGVDTNSLPAGDELNINDQGDTDDHTYTISPTAVTRDGAGTITYATIETLKLNAGSGVDTITGTTADAVNTFITSQGAADLITVSSGATANVQIDSNAGTDNISIQATGLDSITIVNAGDGNDDINIGSAAPTLDAILGIICVQGDANDATPTIDFTCGPVTNSLARGDALSLNDSADTDANTYTLSVTDLVRNGKTLVVFDTMETLRLKAGTGADTITIDAKTNVNTFVSGNTGNDTFTANVGATANLEVNGQDGLDTITLTGSGAGSVTFLNGGNNNDTFNIVAAGGSLDNIGGATCVDGGANDATPTSSLTCFGVTNTLPVGDTLNFHDAGDASANTYTLTATDLTRTGMTVPITFVTVETVVLNAGTGANTITVTTTNPSTTTIINGNVGIDTITVNNTGASSNTQVNAGAAADVITVKATATGSITELNGGANNDTFNIVAAGGSLDTILGSICVNGDANDAAPTTDFVCGVVTNKLPTGDVLNFNDQGDTDNNTYVLTTTDLMRGTAKIGFTTVETINLNAGTGNDTITATTAASVNTFLNGNDGNDSITFSTGTTANVQASGGNGADKITVLATGTGSVTLVFGGAGNDDINIGSAAPSLDTILGIICVQGDANDATPTIDFTCGPVTNSLARGDALSLNDSADTDANTYTLSVTDLVRNGKTLVVFDTVETLRLKAGTGADTITIDAKTNVNTFVSGNTGNDTFTANVGATANLEVNGQDGLDTITLTGSGAGSVTFLNGGNNNDTFNIVAAGGSLDNIGGATCVDGGANDATPTSSLSCFGVTNTLPVGDTLNFHDAGDASANTYTLTATDLTRTGMTVPIAFLTVETVVLNAGTGANTITVTTTNPSTTTIINGNAGIDTITINNTGTSSNTQVNAGAGADVITVAATATGSITELNGGANNDTFNIVAAGGSLDTILGIVCVNGDANDAAPTTDFTCGVVTNKLPTGDVLNFNDQGDTDNNTYVLTTTDLTRGTAKIGFTTVETINLNAGSGNDTINATTLASVNTFLNGSDGNDSITFTTATTANVQVNAGTGTDTINARGTGTGSVTLINGEAGNDTINIGSTAPSLDAILGIICVDGGANDAAPTIDFTCGVVTNSLPSGDELNFNDTADTDANDYTLSVTDLIRNGTTLTVFSTIETVKLNAGTGNDTIGVDAKTNVNTFVNGNTGNDKITANVGATANLEVNGQDGLDTITLTGSGAGSVTFLNGGNNNDTFNIVAAGGSLDNIGGATCVDGGANDATPTSSLTCFGVTNTLPVGDTLNFNDAGDASANTYTLTATDLTRTGMTVPITFLTVETVVLNAGTGANTITVTTTNPSTTTIINGNAGIDTITIENTGASSNTQVNAGAAADVITVKATAAGSITELNGGANNDTFNIVAAGGSLDTILGSVCVNGDANDAAPTTDFTCGVVTNKLPTGDVLNFNDAGDTDNNTYVLTTTDLTRGTAKIGFTTVETINLNAGTGNDTINATTLASVNTFLNGSDGNDSITFTTATTANVQVNAGTGTDTINARGTGTGSVTLINGEAGNDTINIGSTAPTLDVILGIICVDGGANDATPTIDFTCGVTTNSLPSGDELNFNDTADTDANDYTLSVTDLIRNGTTLTVFSTIETVKLNAGTGNDTIGVDAKTNVNTFVNGNAGNDKVTLNVGATANVQINGQAGQDNITVTGTGTGSVALLNGGANDDIFNIVQAGGSLDNVGGSICVDGGTQDGATKVALACDPSVFVLVGDQLNFNDQGDASDNTYTLDNGKFTRTGMPGEIIFLDIEQVSINAGTGKNTIIITAPLAGSFTVINGGAAADDITINNTTAGSLLQVNAGKGDDTVTVLSTAAGSVTEVNGQENNDTFNIVQAGGNLDAVQGIICFDGGANDATPLTTEFICGGIDNNQPVGDTLNLNDQGNGVNTTYVIDTAGFTRNGKQLILFVETETLKLNAGTGNNAISATTTASLNTYITALGGNDTITVNTGTASNLLLKAGGGADLVNVETTGNLSVNLVFGEAGDDTINVGKANTIDGILGVICVDGGTELDVLNINDGADTDANTYDITDKTIDRNGGLTEVFYNQAAATDLETLNVNAGIASDLITVNNISADTTVNADGGNLAIGGNDLITILAADAAGKFLTVNGNIGLDQFDVIATGASAVKLFGNTGNDSFNIFDTGTGTLLANGNENDDTFQVFGIGSGAVTLLGNGGKDFVTVFDTGAGKLTVDTGADEDRIDTHAIGTGGAEISGGAANDTFNIFGAGAAGTTVKFFGDDVAGTLEGNDIFCVLCNGTTAAGRTEIFGGKGADGFFFLQDANGDNAVLGDGFIDGGPGATPGPGAPANIGGGNAKVANLNLAFGKFTFPNLFLNDLISFEGWTTATNGKTTGGKAVNNVGVVVDLTAGTASMLPDGTSALVSVVTLANVENVIGTEFNDYVTGNKVANLLVGLGGNDCLNGMDGKDAIIGGDGNDLIIGGNGADAIEGNDGADVMVGDNLTINNGGGFTPFICNPTLDAMSLAVDSKGLPSVNTAKFSTATGTGADTLHGGAGSDQFFGGPAFDIFLVDSCADVCAGVARSDRVFNFGPGGGQFQLFNPGRFQTSGGLRGELVAADLIFLLNNRVNSIRHPVFLDTNPNV